MRNLLIFLLATIPVVLSGQDKVVNYIDTYQDIAVSEMHRSGIPASITLAQGMFESGYGLSESAINFNNHFGIKCKKEWEGSFYFKKDDDRNEHGELIPSCFRAYDSAHSSFQDHTNFLVERGRYAELFTFHQTDYYNWAMGLERCGYATNPMYAEGLVEIIERYSLWKYDVYEKALPVLVEVSASEIGQEVFVTELDKAAVKNESTELISTNTAPQIDSIVLAQIPIEAISEPQRVNRINKAIILPPNYQRSVQQSVEVTDMK